MKLWRILSMVAVSLAMSGCMLGSEPEKRLQARWSELKKLIGGKKVALQLSDGARVEGRVNRVTNDALVVKVKKSSQPAAYPKGNIQIARADVVGIEVRDLFVDEKLAAKRKKQTARTVATSLGAGLGGGLLTLYLLGYDRGAGAVIGGSFGVGAIVAVLTNLLPRPKDITFIETVPDFPMERVPKSSDQEQSSVPNQDTSSPVSESLPVDSEPLILPAFKHNDIGAVVPSPVEQSSLEQIRRQARRAVMRHDLPFDLSILPVHAPGSGIDGSPLLCPTQFR